jgi:hypothetical protein
MRVAVKVHVKSDCAGTVYPKNFGGCRIGRMIDRGKIVGGERVRHEADPEEGNPECSPANW